MTAAKAAGSRAFVVSFSQAGRWSPGSFREEDWAWPPGVVRPLRAALVPVHDPLPAKRAAGVEIPLITLRFDGSMEPRGVDAEAIKGRLFLARAGDLVYSKIDVRNGAIGVVPAHLPEVAVTAEYPVNRLRTEVAGIDYVRLLVRSAAIRRQIQARISGASGRKRIQPEDLLDLAAPLPALAVQEAIFAHAEKAEVAVRSAEGRRVNMLRTANATFLAGLGLVLPEEGERPKMLTLRWSAVERWGFDANHRGRSGLGDLGSRFPVVRLGDVIADLENGWSPKCLPRVPVGEEWGVLKLGAVSFGTYDDVAIKALPSNLSAIPAFEVKPGDVLISRGNVPRLVGAAVYVPQTRVRLMLPDLIFRVVFGKPSRILPQFLAALLQTPPLRYQIESACTGSSPTMQKVTKPALLGLRLPLPPLDVQRGLVEAHAVARAAADTPLADARANRTAVMAEVDAMILGTLPVPIAQE